MKLEEAARFTGSIPENYDRYLGPHIFHGFADEMALRAAQQPSSDLLEIAAGTGIVTSRLQQRLSPDCTITATDLNPPMLDVAREKLDNPASITFETADATALPFADASFDTVVCQFGVMFFPDKHQAYSEVSRVLKPGGRYLFSAWGSLEANPFAYVANELLKSLFPDNPPGFYEVPFSYHAPEVIEQDVARAGFDTVTVETVTIESTISSAEDFATGLVYGNPLSDEVIDRGGSPEAVVAAIAAALNANLGDTMPLQALLVDARVA